MNMSNHWHSCQRFFTKSFSPALPGPKTGTGGNGSRSTCKWWDSAAHAPRPIRRPSMIRRAGSPDHIRNLNPIRAFPPMKKKERQIVRPSKLTMTHETCIQVRFSCLSFFGVQRKMTRILWVQSIGDKNCTWSNRTPHLNWKNMQWCNVLTLSVGFGSVNFGLIWTQTWFAFFPCQWILIGFAFVEPGVEWDKQNGCGSPKTFVTDMNVLLQKKRWPQKQNVMDTWSSMSMYGQKHDKPGNVTMTSHTCGQPGKTGSTNHTSAIDENKKRKHILSSAWSGHGWKKLTCCSRQEFTLVGAGFVEI